MTVTVLPEGHPIPESSTVLFALYVAEGEVSVGLGVMAGGYEQIAEGDGLAAVAFRGRRPRRTPWKTNAERHRMNRGNRERKLL